MNNCIKAIGGLFEGYGLSRTSLVSAMKSQRNYGKNSNFN
jgi:hypothetical protein